MGFNAGGRVGSITNLLFSKFTEAGGATTLRRFEILGARHVCILWKADSGTPTITIGGYVHPNATRDTTLTNWDLVTKSNGASVAAGQNNYIYPSAAAADLVTPAADCVIGLQELDVQVAGNVTNLDVEVVILF